MTTTPTPEQFLTLPTDPEDDDLDPMHNISIDPLESMADSLRTIAASVAGPIAARDAEAADAHAEELRELGQAYDDLEAKHQSLYGLLADVEKIVAKSKSQVSLEVKAAINAWRNPTVDPEPPVEGLQPPQDPIPGVDVLPVPAADAGLGVWREYAEQRGVEGAESMNRSQIRTALGLSHFEG